eukprot:3796375-Alexandrium_andersonii.AAC.1
MQCAWTLACTCVYLRAQRVRGRAHDCAQCRPTQRCIERRSQSQCGERKPSHAVVLCMRPLCCSNLS